MRVTRTASDIAWTAGLVLALAWAAIVYRPILGGYFYADDFGNLFRATNRAPLEFNPRARAGHIQYIPRTTYYTLLRLIGPDPRWFFALMLGTHLANVGLLYAVGYALTGFPALACLGAALWGSLRINEGTLGWYTVIGQAFATLLILIVLHGLSRAARRGTLSTREASGWFALLLLSCVSFGTAMPVAALFPFVAWTVLPPGTASRGARSVLWSLSLVVPVAYVIAYALYLRAYEHDDKEATFVLGRVFSPGYFVWGAAGTLQLLRAGLTSLIYGVTTMPRAVSKASYLVPITLALLLAGAAASWIRERRWIGALALLTVSVYAMIAFGRAVRAPRQPCRPRLGGALPLPGDRATRSRVGPRARPRRRRAAAGASVCRGPPGPLARWHRGRVDAGGLGHRPACGGAGCDGGNAGEHQVGDRERARNRSRLHPEPAIPAFVRGAVRTSADGPASSRSSRQTAPGVACSETHDWRGVPRAGRTLTLRW